MEGSEAWVCVDGVLTEVAEARVGAEGDLIGELDLCKGRGRDG